MSSTLPTLRLLASSKSASETQVSFCLELSPKTYLLGRSQSADFILTDTLVSSRHLEIKREESQVFVRDLHSKHGSFFVACFGQQEEEKSIPASQDWSLWRQDQLLRIGTSEFILQGTRPEASHTQQNHAHQTPFLARVNIRFFLFFTLGFLCFCLASYLLLWKTL